MASIKAKRLTEEQIAAINNYSSQIVTMKDDIEAIQKLAGMYISGKGNLGYMTIFREIYQNAIDQLIDKFSPCDSISVFFNEQTMEATVIDNGKGIPFDDMIRIFTKSHTSQNYNKKAGDYASGINGLGAKCTNAYSRTFIVESYHYDGEARRMVFKNGYPVAKEPEKIPNKEKFNGTNIYFVPSDLLGKITVSWHDIYDLVRNIGALTPIGSMIEFTAIDHNGKEHYEQIINQDGINYFLIKMTSKPIVKPITAGADNGHERSFMTFTWDAAALDGETSGEQVVAYVNTSPIYDAGSTNITGSLKGITTWFQKYMNDIYLAKSKTKVRVLPSDIKEGLCLAIDSASIDPQFSGQAKQKLTNEEMDPFCKSVIMAGLDEWSKNNPSDLQKVAGFIFDIAKIRTNADKEKVKVSANYQASAFGGGLPASYKMPSGKDHLELWICEGLSAQGALVQARDPVHDGIYPIKGKIISAFTNSEKKIFENAEVQGIFSIIFRKGPVDGKKLRGFTANDCKFDKIIFASDADIDGYHIASLLLRLFIMYCPYLIEAGMIYKAMPPLYMVPKGSKRQYYLDNSVMAHENQKIFKKEHTISLRGTTLTDKQVEDLVVRNADYIFELESAAKNHGLAPDILEIVLADHVAGGKSKIEDVIKKRYKFVKCSKIAGINKIEISSDELYTIYCTEDLYNDCAAVMKLMKSNDSIYYDMNGENVSLYKIMKEFETTMPAGVQRYKGLGEMDPDQLSESTVSRETRSLVRYTVNDVKEEVERIRRIESDKKQIFDYVGVVTRDDLIGC